jgi:hypothetical protein
MALVNLGAEKSWRALRCLASLRETLSGFRSTSQEFWFLAKTPSFRKDR